MSERLFQYECCAAARGPSVRAVLDNNVEIGTYGGLAAGVA